MSKKVTGIKKVPSQCFWKRRKKREKAAMAGWRQERREREIDEGETFWGFPELYRNPPSGPRRRFKKIFFHCNEYKMSRGHEVKQQWTGFVYSSYFPNSVIKHY